MFGHDDSKDDNNQVGSSLPVVTDGNVSSPPVAGGIIAAPATDSTSPSPSFPNIPTSPSSDDSDNGGDDAGELIAVKQQVLQDLHPLVNHLDQTPEEKFKTLMMMLQATDDKTLVQTAYETAKQITDEKARAQALLDVVNEINYFTQPKS